MAYGFNADREKAEVQEKLTAGSGISIDSNNTIKAEDNSLVTTDKTLVGAINEAIGANPSTLTTTSKTLVGAINETSSHLKRTNTDFNVSTLDALKSTLQSMVMNSDLYTLQVYQLRTIDMTDTSLLPKTVFVCLAYRSAENYGEVFLYSYGTSDLHVFKYYNSNCSVVAYSGTNKGSWTT